MELPPLSKPPAGGNTDLTAETLKNSVASLIGAQKLTPGSKFSATVEKILVLTETQQKQLLSKLAELIEKQGGLSSRLSDNHTSRDANQTSRQDPLSKTLRLVRLSVLGKSLMVFTDQMLTPQQKISLTVRTDGQLLLNTLQNYSQASQSSKQIPVQSNSSSPAQPLQENKAQASQAINSAGNDVEQKTLLRTMPLDFALRTLSDGLRFHLPRQQSIAVLLKTLSQIIKILIELPTQYRNKVLPQQLLSFAKSITAQVATTQELQSPTGLKRIFENSGAYLENKLQRIASNTAQVNQGTEIASRLTKTASGNINNISSELANLGKNKLNAEPNPAVNISAQDSIDSKNRPALDLDLKAQLLRLTETLIKLPTIKDSPRNNAELSQSLKSLLFLLAPNKVESSNTQSFSSIRADIATQLRGLIQASIGRLTSLQIRHLVQHLQEPNVTASGGFFEIPYRIQDNLYALILQIQERYFYEEDDEEKDDKREGKTRKKRKRWQVFMEFDLEEQGWFASEITLDEPKVHTKFWVQNDDLRSKARAKIEILKAQLENDGIEVDEIVCMEGAPPQRDLEIHQALVDVTT